MRSMGLQFLPRGAEFAIFGLEKLSGGVNTARQDAWAAMPDSGWHGKMAGVAMQRPNEPGYNRPGVFLIDDWR
jgi:hypothetical protein